MPSWWRPLKRQVVAALTVLCASAAFGPLAMAQEEEISYDKSSWVLSYALVLLAITLGLVAICRPGNRSKDVKTEEE